MRKIRELDFEAIVGRIAGATNKAKRVACDGTTQTMLEHVRTPRDAWETLRDALLIAALRNATELGDVGIDKPIVEALVRAQHHPLADSLPEVGLRDALHGPNVAPHFTSLSNKHAELRWDLDAIQRLVIRAIREHGDHELDETQPPWLMHWDRASAAATALIDLVTLRTLGELT
jgi:hypothetical protein